MNEELHHLRGGGNAVLPDHLRGTRRLEKNAQKGGGSRTPNEGPFMMKDGSSGQGSDLLGRAPVRRGGGGGLDCRKYSGNGVREK